MKFLPTPEQIREACWEIQSGWSAAEERRRRVCEEPETSLSARVVFPSVWNPDTENLDW